MSSIEQLKSEAAALEAKARAEGHPMKHAEALERVARNHGYDNWRACRAVLGAPGSARTAQQEKPSINNVELKRYISRDWNFAIDIPVRWNAFPAVPTNSPNEVIRFASHEDGVHYSIIFRHAYDPKKGRKAFIDLTKDYLVKDGFGNFAQSETTIGSLLVPTLDFDKTIDHGPWSVRHYFVFYGTLAYVVSFGTTEWGAMLGLFDRMAKTFVVDVEATSSRPAP